MYQTLNVFNGKSSTEDDLVSKTFGDFIIFILSFVNRNKLL